MFVRVIKQCECTLSFWHDRNWGNRWKNDDWEQKEQQEILKPDQKIEALRVRPMPNKRNHCCIDVVFMGDMINTYMDVPRDCIETDE